MSGYVPRHRDGASADPADYLIYEDAPEAEMEEERAAFHAVPWPFRSAAEARASVRRQLRALIDSLPCRPMRVLTWDDEREIAELRRRHTGLMALEHAANAAIKELSNV